MIKIDIITLFPEMFDGPFSHSILKRAQEKGLLDFQIHNLRKWAEGKRSTVDGRPYGGGAGMIIKVDVISKAVDELRQKDTKVILLEAVGKRFTQKHAEEFSREKHIVFLCGHYEGFDHRVHEHLVDSVVSLGDFVLTGGEIPAMAIADAVVRLVPGVIDKESLEEESHSEPGKLEYPQYTRPEEFRGWKVPDVLLTGDHKKINDWREEKRDSNS